ncbi:hypothetical protein X975_21680, partial [Stegodyphus mimosarum]
MIAKIALLLAFVAAAQSSTLLAPGLLNAGVLAPSAVSTSSAVAIPGAITTDNRIISNGLWAGSPLLLSNGIIGNRLIGASPLALSNGIISPIGLRGASLLAAPEW